jgi:outer membrane protein assembly factor BamB
MIIIASPWACNDPLEDIPACSEDPCSTNACTPQDCTGGNDSTFLGLDTLWASKPNLIKGFVKQMVQSDQYIFLNLILPQGYDVQCYSKEDGSLQWNFNSYPTEWLGDMHFDIYSDRLILQDRNTIISLNPYNGEKITQKSVFEGEQRSRTGAFGKLLDGYYYTPMEINNRTVGGAVRSKTTDLQNWEWAYRITQSEVDGIEPSTDSYNLWIHPETGDEILLLQHRMAFWEKRIDLVAYNMTADSMYWWHKDIEPQGNSNIRQIQIFKDRAYFQGSNTIHAVNMIDGTYQWKYEDTEKSFVCCHNIVFDEAANVVVDNYSNIDQSGIMAWDADNGTVKWNNTQENNYQAEDKIVFEGMLLQADGSLDKYIISNGRLEFALSDTERWLGFDQLIIDKKKQVLYTLFGSNGSAGRQLIAISVESIENF